MPDASLIYGLQNEIVKIEQERISMESSADVEAKTIIAETFHFCQRLI